MVSHAWSTAASLKTFFRLAALTAADRARFTRRTCALVRHAATLPPGWQMWEIGSNLPPVRDWPTLMQTVGQVRFLYAPPGTISNFPVWNVGIDNIAIIEGACYANCDGSTVAPILNVGDFTCFLNAYAAGQSTANCDSSTAPPVLNVSDFVCFLNAYAAGCST